MLLGVPKEIKDSEYRVGLVPSSVRELTANGHQVMVERSAGVGAGLSDADYGAVGAEIVADAEQIYARAEMIVKVKEPLAQERKALKPGQILFTYLHLAADPEQTADLIAAGVIAIAYETVTSAQGTLPLLTPMSEVAGRMAPHGGARCLEKENGGRGVLLGGVPGVPPADVVILGGGVAGTHAALIASGMGATVTVIDRNPEALRRIANQLGARVRTVFSTTDAIETLCQRADLVIASVLIPGAAAPKLIKAATVKAMKPGAVIVDIAIDQGGCAETSRPTTHSSPTYIVDDVVHYCVTNMPGAVARTSTFALNNVTLPFVLAISDKGYRAALGHDPHLRNGLNVYRGMVTHRAVAGALKLKFNRAGSSAAAVKPLALLAGKVARLGTGPDFVDLCRSGLESAPIHPVAITTGVWNIITDVSSMISAAQLRAARALLGIDQRKLAELSALSLPTIQRMEASDGVIRGNVDSLMKLVGALDAAGIELIGENVASAGGGRGVRLKAAVS
jgi:alanine dehydrogenase